MNQEDYINNLSDTLKTLDNSLYHLKRSYNICSSIGAKKEYSDDEFDSFETLTSRYARMIDIVIQKVFRSIDKLEFEDQGTLIDVINRAHKRGFFESIYEIREMKDFRNEIVHEYTNQNLIDLFKDILKYTNKLFDIVEKVKCYCSKYEQR